ncbi:hypothetical protein ARMSODRAFT_297111 [Armillaria solidipes]|uniref:Uncharacterized protein n=1 Tax=Armillaria solidipes TaxID=1076256 RepID=A0A2H3BA13_9AGAR|nr:hypothetical protein ARMSODRAFT_297111 [Armillaria solidipes]
MLTSLDSYRTYYTPSYGLNAERLAKGAPRPDMSLKDKAIPGLMAPCVTREDVFDYCIANGLMKKTNSKKVAEVELEDLIEEEELFLKTHIRRNTFGQWSYLPPPSPTISEVSSKSDLEDPDPDIGTDGYLQRYLEEHPDSRPPKSPSSDDHLAPEAAYGIWRQQLRRSFDGGEDSPPNGWSPSSDADPLESSNRSPSHGDYSSTESTRSRDRIGSAARSAGPAEWDSLVVPEAFYMWSPSDQERFLGIKAPRAPDGSYVCCGERFEFKAFVGHRRASDEHGGFGQGSRRRS